MNAAARKLAVVQPLPLVPAGAVPVADGIALAEEASGCGSVFVWGQVTWTWQSDDPAARRLAAVQLVNARAATQREVAVAFGVNETTVWRWRGDYTTGGVEALVAGKKGPKGPSKLTEDKVADIVALRNEGRSLQEVASMTGVSPQSVRRASAPSDAATATGEVAPSSGTSSLEPLARPVTRLVERQAARRGMLEEAAPRITEGASLPHAGALVILPALIGTGLLDAMAAVYGTGRRVKGVTRAAFYGLRSLVLCVVFASLLSEPRAEGLSRLDPVSVGRLLGLDRAPEVGRLRIRLAELAEEHKSDELAMTLARRHTDIHPEAVGIFYVDGHVRAYHGRSEVPKAHVARMRIAMPAEVDTWVSDRFGTGLLVWQAPPGASLVGELKVVANKLRDLLGPDARPTICFDRGGWSPKLFVELDKMGFDILTYRKAPLPHEPRSAFRPVDFADTLGHTHDYLLSDRRVRIPYDAGRKRFDCRQITRLDERSGHQTQVLTTRKDPDPGPLAHAMFSRWRQENFFRYMRAHFALDALDAYETVPDDADRLVKNPARRDADRALAEARRSLARAQSTQGKAAVAGRSLDKEVAGAFAAAQAEVDRLAAAARAVPAKVPLATIRPTAVRLDQERKRIMDAIRMANYNAESALVRLIGPHYARAEDEARSLLHETFKSSADMEVVGNALHVRIDPLSAPRRTRALAALCEELTATETRYPGTDLVITYSVKES